MHLITRISVIGITITTAALIILIAAFNGIETMVAKLYSEFDAEITIRSKAGKSFHQNTIDYKKLQNLAVVENYTKAIEEIVVLKHEQKWSNARLYAVDHRYLKMAKFDEHIVDGFATFEENGQELGIIGATLLDKLNGFIPKSGGKESLIVYFPKRDSKLSARSNPFRTEFVQLAGRVNYNREVNAQAFILPIDLAREYLDYDENITHVYVQVKKGISLENAKKEIQDFLGSKFEVKTQFEKNALIYQTSKSERLMVIAILIFVFIMAAFNLVASLTMLFIEKKNDLKTMESFGANDRFMFRIFFYEGLLIAGKGILFGLILGYGICLLQLYGNVLEMPNSNGEAFPIRISWQDGLLVLTLVSTLSILASYLPVRYLVAKKNQK